MIVTMIDDILVFIADCDGEILSIHSNYDGNIVFIVTMMASY